MAYKPMINEGLRIETFLIDYFMQWGTPSDLEEFNWYLEIFEELSKSTNNSNHTSRVFDYANGRKWFKVYSKRI